MGQQRFICKCTMVGHSTIVAIRYSWSHVDTAHVLPVLFAFTTPAKFCFRAIATFCKHVTGMVTSPPHASPLTASNVPTSDSLQLGNDMETPSDRKFDEVQKSAPSSSLGRSLSTEIHRALTMVRRRSRSSIRDDHITAIQNEPGPLRQDNGDKYGSSDVGGPRFRSSSHPRQSDSRTAGDPDVYDAASVRIG
jgi:hypothetical protein